MRRLHRRHLFFELRDVRSIGQGSECFVETDVAGGATPGAIARRQHGRLERVFAIRTEQQHCLHPFTPTRPQRKQRAISEFAAKDVRVCSIIEWIFGVDHVDGGA